MCDTHPLNTIQKFSGGHTHARARALSHRNKVHCVVRMRWQWFVYGCTTAQDTCASHLELLQLLVHGLTVRKCCL